MSAAAVAMLVVAVTIVWGGLVASIVALTRHPDPTDPETPTQG